MSDRDTVEELTARIEQIVAADSARLEAARQAWVDEKRALEARHAQELVMAKEVAEMEHRAREVEAQQKLEIKEMELARERTIAAAQADAARAGLVADLADARSTNSVLEARLRQRELEIQALLEFSRYEIRTFYKKREASLAREVEETERRLRENDASDAPARVRESMARVMQGILEDKKADLADTRRKLERVGL